MTTHKLISALLVSTALSGCGGGGGGGGDVSTNQLQNPASTRFVVSTLAIDPSSLSLPSAIAVDSQGNLLVADTGPHLIRKISSANFSTVTTILGISGGGGTDYSTCTNSNLYSPTGIVADSAGHLYVVEQGKSLARYADCTVAPGSSNEYGTNAVGFTLSSPGALALHSGNVYISDTGNNKIKLISRSGVGSGVTTTLAGTSNGYVNAMAVSAAFSRPTGIAVDTSGNVFIADTDNCAIRAISPAGVVSTFAGSAPDNLGTGSCGSSDGTNTTAKFDHPTGLAMDGNNNLYVADTANNKIRRITPQGVVTTIAGSGASGSSDGVGSSATFSAPTGIVVDASGRVFVIDSGNKRIRKITETP